MTEREDTDEKEDAPPLSCEQIDAALEALPADAPVAEVEHALEPICKSLAQMTTIAQERYVRRIKDKYQIRVGIVRSLIGSHMPMKVRFKGAVHEFEGRYVVGSKNGLQAISSFSIRPKEFVTVDGKVNVFGVIVCGENPAIEVVFPEAAWHSRTEFLKCLGGVPNLQFTGTDDNLQGILRLLSRADVPRVQGVRTVGFVQTSDGPRWISVDKIISKDGVVPSDNRLRYVGNRSQSSFARRLKYEDTDHQELTTLARQILPQLLEVNEPAVILPVIGWFFASFFKPLIQRELGHFPILFVWGRLGSGKTTLVKLLWRLVGVSDTKPYSVINTLFPLYDLLASNSSIPVFLDEFKPRDMGERQVDQLHRLLRRVYDGDVEQRGRPDLRVVEYPLTAPVVVAGESRPRGDAALLERLIAVSPNRNHLQANESYKATMKVLQELPLERLALPFIRFALARDVVTDLAKASKAAKTLVSKAVARWNKNSQGSESNPPAASAAERHTDPLHTRQHDAFKVMLFGLLMFKEFAKSVGAELPSMKVDEAVDTSVAALLDGDNGSKDAFDEFLEALSVFARECKLIENTHYAYVNGTLRLHLESCYQVYLVERRRAGLGDDTNGLAALRQLIREKSERRGYVSATSRTILEGVYTRTIEIAVEKVPTTLAFDPFPRNAERRHGGLRVDSGPSFVESSPSSCELADAESAGSQRTSAGPVRFTSPNGNEGESRL